MDLEDAHEDDNYLQADDDEGDGEEYIFVAEGDLDGVYTEEEMLEALASYREVRDALKNQRNGRGFYNRDSFKGKGFGNDRNWGKGKGKGKHRVHIEQLKLRTRCWSCGALGHLSRECTSKGAEKGKGSSSSTAPSSSAPNSKTGFFVVSENAMSAEHPRHFPEAPADPEKRIFWLKKFVEERKRALCFTESAKDQSSYKAAPAEPQFYGITTGSEVGVVDTAAEGGLVGIHALHRLERRLHDHGLAIKWVPKKSLAKGIGGQAQVVGVAMIPVGVGGLNGLLEVTVVEGEVPLLLPVKLLKCMEAIIDFSQFKFILPKEGIELPLHEMPSGHVTIDIMHFAPSGFSIPPNCPFLQEDFVKSFETQAMLAQSNSFPLVAAPVLERPRCSARLHGGLDRAHGQADGRSVRQEERWSGGSGEKPSSKAQDGDSLLASHPGQDLHSAGLRRASKSSARMVPLALTFGAIYSVVKAGRGFTGGYLQRDYHQGEASCASEVQGGSFDRSELLCAPKSSIEGRRQQECLIHHLPNLSLPMGVSPHSSGDQGGLEEEQEGPLEPKSNGHREGGAGEEEGGRHFGIKLIGQVREGAPRAAEVPDDGEGREPSQARSDVEGTPAAEGGTTGEGSEDAGHVPLSDEEGRGGEEASARDERGVRGRQAVSLRSLGSEAEENARGSTRGEAVLDLQNGSMRVLPIRTHHQVSGQSSFRDELCTGGLGGRKEERNEEEEQKSEDRQEEVCRGGDSPRPGQRLKGEEGEPSGLEEPWAVAKNTSARRTLRKVQSGQIPHVRSELRHQVLTEENQWKEEEGIIPLREERPVRIQVWLTKEAAFDDEYGLEKEVQFTSKQRKAVLKGLQTVSEVFSPPRIAAEAHRQGLKQGGSFDLKTGWNLSDPAHKRAMWKQLKEEAPILLIVCPPCCAFSILQSLNYPKMEWDKAWILLSTGLEHLELAAELLKWQHRRGGYFLFEHPAAALSWEEKCLKEVEEMNGVTKVRTDMCMFGMNVSGKGLNKKPTSLLMNSEEMEKALSKTCDKRHFHVPTVCGLPAKAQEYPPAFCKAVIKGLRNQLVKDGGSCERFISVLTGEIGDDEEEEEPGLEEALDKEMEAEEKKRMRGEEEPRYSVTEDEKKSVTKLHKGLGRPQRGEFVRFMRAARIKGEIIRWAYKEFQCPSCEAKPRPKANRPAAIPRTYQPCRALGVDLIFLPEVGGGRLFPALSMVDWGSNYQMVQRVADKQPKTIWNTLWSTRGRTFGLPEVLITDAGREFSSQLMQMASSHGVVTQTIAAKAPWQNGRTERHGQHFKELLEKAREETVITSKEELELPMQEVEMAKNRFSNRSGFSPVQRQIGQWPRVPSSLLGDDVIDPGLMSGAVVDDMERVHEMRRVAQKAFVEHNAREALKRVSKGRTRATQDFQAGDYVYVFRVPRQKKRKHEGGLPSSERTPNKATWVGPGTLIAVDGASLWVSMYGELWRVAREQCRKATNVEQQGIEEVMRSCKELMEDFKRSSNRKGYKDLRGEAWPEEEEEGEDRKEVKPTKEEEEEATLKRRRLEAEEQEEMPGAEEYEPTEPIESPTGPEGSVRSRSPRSRRPSSWEEEPEEERLSEEEGGQEGRTKGDPPAPVRSKEEEEEYERSLAESINRARTLDGLPPTTGPLRWRTHRGPINPYFEEWFLADHQEEESEEEEEVWTSRREKMKKMSVGAKKDYWEVDLKNQCIKRHHVNRRKAKFSPQGMQNLPVPLRCFGERTTKIVNDKEEEEEEREENWQRSKKGGRETKEMWWKGSTEFTLQNMEEREEIQVWATEKTQGGGNLSQEVDLKKESPQDLEEWKVSDSSEFHKIRMSQAIQVLDVKESREVVKKLTEEGKMNRILPSRMARRYKPSEQPGQAPSKKSRLCIRGDKDPDILELERFSPTVSAMNLNVTLQVAVNFGMDIAVGDLQSAFCQSAPLKREKGALYFRQPPEGIDGLHPDQICLIVAGCYGLADAPLHWRRTLVGALKKLGFKESTLDPCIFKLYEGQKLVVNSTLAAETQSLARGLGDLLWMKVLFKEIEIEKFSMHEWASTLSRDQVVAMARDDGGTLKECLAIVDAKSLFDYLSKETIGGQDKRTAIEIQIIRQDLRQLQGEIRWVDHPAMLADPLTKVKGSTQPLLELLNTGEFSISAEAESLKRRQDHRDSGGSNAKLRAGVKVYFGEL